MCQMYSTLLTYRILFTFTLKHELDILSSFSRRITQNEEDLNLFMISKPTMMKLRLEKSDSKAPNLDL